MHLIVFANPLENDFATSVTIVTSLCPGGKERMRRLLNVVASHRVDLRPMVTHRFKLDDIEAAYDLFSHQRDGVLKVAITP
jgi:alcohol dehydrogenase